MTKIAPEPGDPGYPDAATRVVLGRKNADPRVQAATNAILAGTRLGLFTAAHAAVLALDAARDYGLEQAARDVATLEPDEPGEVEQIWTQVRLAEAEANALRRENSALRARIAALQPEASP